MGLEGQKTSEAPGSWGLASERPRGHLARGPLERVESDVQTGGRTLMEGGILPERGMGMWEDGSGDPSPGFYTLGLVPAGMRGKGQFPASSTPGGEAWAAPEDARSLRGPSSS